jgi:probable phosphoglycerate mutase
MTDLLLIRHGENDYTHAHKLAGWTAGVHLNPAGQAQARAMADHLARQPIRAVYSSPLERAIETAQPLARARQLRIQKLAAIGEVQYGDWTGKSLKVLRRTKLWRIVQQNPAAMEFPAGETFRAVQARAVNALDALTRKHPKELIAIVSHGDVIKLILAHYLGQPIDLFQRIMISTGSVSQVRLLGGQPVIVKINEQPAGPPSAKQS